MMSREFTIYTGIAGAQLVHDAIHHEAVVAPLLEKASELANSSLIDANTHTTLTEMIKSPDYENRVLADLIMDTKKPNQDGDNI